MPGGASGSLAKPEPAEALHLGGRQRVDGSGSVELLGQLWALEAELTKKEKTTQRSVAQSSSQSENAGVSTAD